MCVDLSMCEVSVLYSSFVQQLLESGHAYYAFDTPEELDIMRNNMRSSGVQSPTYNSITRASMKKTKDTKSLSKKDFKNKVNKNFYKDWHLNLVKKQKFNQWIKSHEHLFTQSDNSEIKLFEGNRTPNTLLVEIPVSFNVQRIQKEIGKAVKGKVAKTQTNQRFKIQN